MKSISHFIIFTCLHSILLAQIEPSLTVVHSLFSPGSQHPDEKLIHLSIYIKNESSGPIKLPTRFEPPETRFQRDVESTFTFYGRVSGSNPLKMKVVPSESYFEPVTLNPGEAALIKWEQLINKRNLKSIRVVYNVEKDLAVRYGWWSGKLEVVSKPLDNFGRIVEPSQKNPKESPESEKRVMP